MKRRSGGSEGSSELEFWIAGVNPVQEALRRGREGIRELVLSRTDSRVEAIRELAEQLGLPVRFGNRDELTAKVGYPQHQGIALYVKGDPYLPFESFLERPLSELEPLMILDSIQDPQNLGSLLRSSCFLGAKGVLIPKDRSAGITPTVIKVAAGATSYLPVMRVTNLVRALEQIKEAGIWIVGLDVQGTESLYETDFSVPAALVIGNEQKGIRPLVRKHCDLLVHIPAHGPLQSLNAAIAGAVALAELQRQRLRPSG